MGRKEFEYPLEDYGETTDIYNLSVGFKFWAVSPANPLFGEVRPGWSGEIVNDNGVKSMKNNNTGQITPIQKDIDYKMVIIEK